MSIIDAVIKLDVGDISLILGIVSLILGLGGIFLGLMSIKFIKINITAIRKQNETAIKSERNERFKNAIEQLGNDKNAIVLGGIYTLHRIAKEDESYIENVFNILCAYVRETTTAEDYQTKYTEKPSEPIQTILNILCVNKEDLKRYSKFTIDFSDANLTGTYITNAHLTGANLTGANLTSVIFTDAILIGANLASANLTGASLVSANLINANLPYAILTNAFLLNATLINAFLMGVTLTNTNLHEADLKGACSLKTSYNKSFENRIRFRINRQTDFRGIKGGYDPENPPFKGTPKDWRSYTKEEAEEIIKKSH